MAEENAAVEVKQEGEFSLKEKVRKQSQKNWLIVQ